MLWRVQSFCYVTEGLVLLLYHGGYSVMDNKGYIVVVML